MIKMANLGKINSTESFGTVTLEGTKIESAVSLIMRTWCIIYVASLTLITLGLFLSKLIAH